jgi:Tfp pilus assembly protein PilE
MEVAMIIMGIVSAIAGITSTAVSAGSKASARNAQQAQQNLAEDLWQKERFWSGQEGIAKGTQSAESVDLQKAELRNQRQTAAKQSDIQNTLAMINRNPQARNAVINNFR